MLRYKKWLLRLAVAVIALMLFMGACYLYIQISQKKRIFKNRMVPPRAYTVIIPGCKVWPNGMPSGMLQDRLDVGLWLFSQGYVKRFLLSGDHGTSKYDEVNSMKMYLNGNGIPDSLIFLDHAGFDTHSTMQRAVQVFEVTDAIIVSQEMYLPRSIYLARNSGINAWGYASDWHKVNKTKKILREIPACTKAVFDILFHIKPKFLGPKIPITGSSKATFDK